MAAKVRVLLIAYRVGTVWLGCTFGLAASRGADNVAVSFNSVFAYLLISWASRKVILAFLGQVKGQRDAT